MQVLRRSRALGPRSAGLAPYDMARETGTRSVTCPSGCILLPGAAGHVRNGYGLVFHVRHNGKSSFPVCLSSEQASEAVHSIVAKNRRQHRPHQ